MADTDKLHDIVKDLQAEDAARRERMTGFSASLGSSCGIRRDQLFPNERPYDFSSTPTGPVELSVPGVEEELHRQAEAQDELLQHLKQEAKERSHDDKKYFWLGALVSLVTSLLVEHGAELIAALQQLFQQ